MHIIVPIVPSEFISLMMETQTEDATFPKTKEGMVALWNHFVLIENQHTTDLAIDALLLNACWTEYPNIGVLKKSNFKVGSKTHESLSEVKESNTVVECKNSSIILIASTEAFNEYTSV
tara:strand:+ start:493 stop:849 length:357 start_codon:yes stop_codon:yes gene_type:complete